MSLLTRVLSMCPLQRAAYAHSGCRACFLGAIAPAQQYARTSTGRTCTAFSGRVLELPSATPDIIQRGQIQAITHDRIQAPHRRIWSLPTNRASWPPQMPCFETLPVTFVHPHHSAPRHGAARGPTSQRAAARRRAQPHATATRTPRVQCAIHAAAAHHDRAARNTAQHVLHGPGATRWTV